MSWFAHDRRTRRARARYRLTRRVLGNMRRRLRFRTALFLGRCRFKLVTVRQRALRTMGMFLATLVGLAIAVAFVFSLPQAFLDNPSFKVSEVHLACAGIIGTALALVLTLSIIPAQKAADVFSSAILNLYARDPKLLLVFAWLSFLALISVLFGTNWTFQVSPRYTLAVQFVALGAALDALRGFYTRTLALLVPANALQLVSRVCDHYIEGMRREIERLVRIHRLSRGKLAVQDESIPRWMFYTHSQISHLLSAWTDQLEEFAHKALSRRDTQAANDVVKTMVSIGIKYADSRRDSLVVLPDFSGPIPSPVSDVGNVLNPMYESLKDICEDAVRQTSEAVAIGCLEAFGDRAVHALTMLHTQDQRRKTAPLAHGPVFYLDLCTKRAIPAGMDDALLTAIGAMGKVFGKISTDVDTQATEVMALDCLFEIATTSYSRKAVVPCFRAVEMMLRATGRDLQVRGFRPASMLAIILPKIASLVPLEVLMEKAGQRVLQTFPSYDLAFEVNIPALLSMLAVQVKPVDPNQKWINPFREFAEASRAIVLHYRKVAESVAFDGALLQKWIVGSILASADVHINLIANPPSGSERFLDSVDDRLSWFIHAPSFFFQETTSFPWYADEAAAGLARLGLRLLRLQRLTSIEACGKAIAAIGSRAAMAQETNGYASADIFVKLEQLARAADALGQPAIAQKFREEIAKPKEISEQVLPEYLEAIQRRIQQLDEREGGYPLPGFDQDDLF
jgi:hypothetical protein